LKLLRLMKNKIAVDKDRLGKVGLFRKIRKENRAKAENLKKVSDKYEEFEGILIKDIRMLKSIQQHLDDIISGEIPEPKECCPRCFSKPGTFKLHECRKRAFRYIAGNFVKVLITLLARWKCLDCGKTFTIYPPFAAPHKRYTMTDILSLRNKLIQDEQQTCYTAVTHEGSPIGYQEENEKNVDHFLAPSTLWRWIKWSSDIKK